MRQDIRACLTLCAVLFLWGAGHSWTSAAEGFHPEGVDPRRIETDKRASEKRKSEEKREDSEAWFKKAVDGKDLSHEPKAEFHDADQLLKESEGRVTTERNDKSASGTEARTSRLKGVPENWAERPALKGRGTEYINPDNVHDRVRVMESNPSSNFPAQRQDYVKAQKNGRSIDKDGNYVDSDSEEAHIPRNDFNWEPKK